MLPSVSVLSKDLSASFMEQIFPNPNSAGQEFTKYNKNFK